MLLAEVSRMPVHTVEPSCALRDAARIMCERSVGALVITDASAQTPIGIVTDRDLVRLIGEGCDADAATVDLAVRAPLHTVSVTEGLSAATRIMREHGVRRLPIVDEEGRLLGVVTLDDILVLLGRELADVAVAVRAELARERRVETEKKGP